MPTVKLTLNISLECENIEKSQCLVNILQPPHQGKYAASLLRLKSDQPASLQTRTINFSAEQFSLWRFQIRLIWNVWALWKCGIFQHVNIKSCRSINDTAATRSTLTRSRMICDMVVLASTTMVAVLSSRISFSRGVGSWLSSIMRTDSVSFEMRNRRRRCSRFRRPVGELNIKKQRNKTLEWRITQRGGSSRKQSNTWSQICNIFVLTLQSWWPMSFYGEQSADTQIPESEEACHQISRPTSFHIWRRQTGGVKKNCHLFN